MTTAVEPEAVLSQSDEGDGDHLYCCDPGLSLCGLDISGAEEDGLTVEGDEEWICPTCRAAVGQPCGNPKCPDRTWRWRLRRWLS